MTSKELLTALQLAGGKVNSNSEFIKSIENTKGVFDQDFIKTYLKPEYKRLPTNFQSSHFYDIIEESFLGLKETVAKGNIKFKDYEILSCDIPTFGTVDFKEFNAFVETTDTDSVIVFNEGLLMFIQRLKQIYTLELWIRSKKKMTEEMKKLLTLNFFDIMLSFHLFSNAYYAIPLDWCNIEDLSDIDSAEKLYELESPFDEFISDLDYMFFDSDIGLSTYLWIAAHEYSHIVLGHLKNNNGTSKLHLNGIEVDKINLNKKQELDADLLGAIITFESDSSLFSEDGIYFALACMLLSSMENKETPDISYPSVKERIKNIFSNIQSYVDYPIHNQRHIDVVFSRKYQDFRKMLRKIDEDNMFFSSIDEMQHYIYKIYPLEK